MRSRRITPVVLTAALTLLSVGAAAGQSAYVAGGGGHTSVLEGGGSGGENWFGALGYPGRNGIGFRVSGTETVDRS